MRRIAWWMVLAVSVGCSGDEAGPNEKDSNNPTVIITDALCGDGRISGEEVCDGEALGGESCEARGFGGGVLGCQPGCAAFDLAECGAPASCGNGAVDDIEACDGDDLAAATCESLGFGPGTLTCLPNCAQFETSRCGPLATCGDGDIDVMEVCDGADLGSGSCAGLGLGSGTLACASNCQRFVTTGCSDGCIPDCSATECGPDPACGTECGSCEAGEQCTGTGVCECVPLTCADTGAECGTLDDGCGGTLDCDECDAPRTCGIDGTPNMCGCEVVAGGSTIAVDVPVVDVTFALTIGGQPLTLTNTNSSDEGGLILVDVVTGERIYLTDAYDGTVTYPQTRRVIPGVYDIYYYNDGATEFWPINDNNKLLEGVDLTSSKTITVDVPVVDITFALTIGGQTPTLANTNSSDEGGLILVDPVSGERIFLPDAYDGTLTYPQTRRVIPGTYDVYYYNDGATTFWPINDNNKLMEAVDLTSSKTLDVDVPVVDITFALTVGGQPPTLANTNSSDEGGLILVDPATNERIYLPDAYDGTLTYPQTRRVIPGIYDVYYYNDGATEFWPINDDNKLMEGVDLTSTKMLNVDVPVVDITFALTIGGAALNLTNTNSSDEGGLILVDPVTSERIHLPDAYDGTITYPQTRRVIPGTYDVYYYNNGATDFWPVNDNNKLMEGVDLTSSKTVSVDVPVVDISFALTIGGQALSVTNTNSSDEGGLILADPVSAERIYLPDAYDGTITYPQTRRVIPGTYDIYYYNDGATDFWPINDNKLLMTGVQLDASKAVAVDVPVVPLTFDLTVGGQPLTLANTNSSDEGGLVLVDAVTAEQIYLPDAYDGTIVYPQLRRVIPGTYEVYYYNDGATNFWPVNDHAVLTCFAVQ